MVAYVIAQPHLKKITQDVQSINLAHPLGHVLHQQHVEGRRVGAQMGVGDEMDAAHAPNNWL